MKKGRKKYPLINREKFPCVSLNDIYIRHSYTNGLFFFSTIHQSDE